MAWDRPDAPSPFTLEETTQRLGWYRWAELRLYEAMGAWVPSIPELQVRLAVGAACGAHAWHADVWRERAALGVVPRDPAPPSAGAAAVLEAVAAATGTVERLVGAYRVVVPRLVAAYTAHANHTSAATDGPLARAFTLVLTDELAAWREGELLVQSLLVDGPTAHRAAGHQGRLEALLAGPGGLAGPATLDPRRARS